VPSCVAVGREDVIWRSLRRQRTRAQLLEGPGLCRVDEIVSHMLAVQAQELNSARLAIRARSNDLAARHVDSALTVDRSVVVAWLGRGTLHLVHRDDYPWLLALTAPGREASNRRRLRQEGVSANDAERAVSVVQAALGEEGPLTRPELAERMAAHEIPTAGQATPHLLMLAALRGVSVLGPIKDGAQAFVLTEEWLGTRPDSASPDKRPAIVRQLAERYLRGHAPAEPADLAAWSGLGLRDARFAFESLNEREADDAEPATTTVRLLPSYDPYLLGWKDRSFVVADTHKRDLHPGGGVLRATVLVDGEAVGTWSHRRRGANIEINVNAFAPFSAQVEELLEREALDVARFEGLTLSR
jgi:Winged helix DNA-binding domain